MSIGSNIVALFQDGPLKNLMSGRGTSVDRASHNFWYFTPKTHDQIGAAYRGSWLVSRIVDLPAKDMLREWRDWQAEADEITRITDIESRLKLRQKLRDAVIMGRLGGGAILLGLSDGDASQPIRDGLELRYLHVVSRHELGLGVKDTDPNSDRFGEPVNFTFGSNTIHPSRVIPFKGEYVPALPNVSWQDAYWGDSIIDRVDMAVQNATTATDGFASLIDEAKVDIYKLDGLTKIALGGGDGIDKMKNRLNEMASLKSAHRAMYLDAGDDWQARQLSFAGIPDVIKTYLGIVAGAADIPATRLLGKSPDGMNATGEGDMKNYWARIRADQSDILRPALQQLDPFILRMANASPESYYEFAPLDTPSEKEGAEIEKLRAETVKLYQDTGLIDSDALGTAALNSMYESNRWPGLEDAVQEAALEPDELEPEGGDTSTDVEGMNDAAPRTLYVSRKLLNGADVLKWAKGQGFTDTLAADDLHVTIMYSRKAVNWMEMGQSWQTHDDGKLTINEGGARLLDRLGDNGEAVVLLFASSELSWRHEEMVHKGAGWDYPEYQPHVTISYDADKTIDISAMEPYRGKLIFGPEIFEEVNENWKAEKGIEEGA